MNTLSQTELQDGWQLLFDGTSFGGWHGYNKDHIGQGWQVKDNSIHFDGGDKTGESRPICNDIITDKIFSDFHLKTEWKISVNGNSGIMFHVQEGPIYRTPWLTGPEMQLLDNDGHHDGLLAKHRAGDLYDLVEGSIKTVKPAGEWNLAEIIVQRSQLKLGQNGHTIVAITLWDEAWKKLVSESNFKDMPDFAKSGKGQIALQDHGGAVWFRNIKIKEL
ncbi:MAG: DUF1080 domain-containing protein [Ferruginibacter sp.]